MPLTMACKVMCIHVTAAIMFPRGRCSMIQSWHSHPIGGVWVCYRFSHYVYSNIYVGLHCGAVRFFELYQLKWVCLDFFSFFFLFHRERLFTSEIWRRKCASAWVKSGTERLTCSMRMNVWWRWFCLLTHTYEMFMVKLDKTHVQSMHM